jgi:hypothetical protein
VRFAFLFASTVALLCALGPSSAIAQPNETVGEQLFREGRELLGAGKVAEACAKFEQSYDLEKALGSLLNLANCEEQRKRFKVALGRWREAAKSADTQKNRLYALGRASELEQKMPKVLLRIGAGAAGAEVTLDGERAALGEKIAVDPGKHVIVATRARPAGPPSVERRELELAEGQALEVELFRGSAAPTRERVVDSVDWSLPGWISLGVGGAGAVVFAATAGVVYEKCHGELGGKSFVCQEDDGTPAEKPTGLLVANLVGAIAGGLGLGLGATFLILEATDEEAPAQVEAYVAPDGLGFRGVF